MLADSSSIDHEEPRNGELALVGRLVPSQQWLRTWGRITARGPEAVQREFLRRQRVADHSSKSLMVFETHQSTSGVGSDLSGTRPDLDVRKVEAEHATRVVLRLYCQLHHIILQSLPLEGT